MVKHSKFDVCKINITLILDACTDIDAGHLDSVEGGCDTYRHNSWCGQRDDEDFQAQLMCCFCGGGSNPNGSNHAGRK